MALTASNTATCTIAPYRAWANGFCLFATNVSTAIAFQSNATSALATADASNRLTINTLRSLRVPFDVLPLSLFICPLRSVQQLAVGGRMRQAATAVNESHINFASTSDRLATH